MEITAPEGERGATPDTHARAGDGERVHVVEPVEHGAGGAEAIARPECVDHRTSRVAQQADGALRHARALRQRRTVRHERDRGREAGRATLVATVQDLTGVGVDHFAGVGVDTRLVGLARDLDVELAGGLVAARELRVQVPLRFGAARVRDR